MARAYDVMSEQTGSGQFAPMNAASAIPVGERTISLPPMGEQAGLTTGASRSAFSPLMPNTDSQTSDPNDMEMNMDGLGPIGGSASEAGVSATKHHHKALIITLSIVVMFIVLAIASFFGARWYFQDKVAPGVTFANTSVTGKTASELNAIVKQQVADSTIALADSQGISSKATLKDLGVSVNVDATVKKLLNAKTDNDFERINPFVKQSVPLSATQDKLVTQTYLTNTFVKESDRAVASSVAFDAASHTFKVTAGKSGQSPDITSVNKAVTKAIARPGASSSVNIAYGQVDMPISQATAQKTADEANQRLANTITINNGDSKTFDVPVDQVAAWIKMVSDPDKGTISLDYDKQAVTDYMSAQLPEQLNQDMVSQEDVINNAGTVLMTTTQGVNGIAVKNTSAVADQVINALNTNKAANIQADADITKFDIKQVKPKYHIVVDKTSQIATVYDGNNAVVKTFLVCTGRAGGNESDNGTFAIYLKYGTQDMTGLNDDGSRYLSKGVKWVSYYNGGEGFHTANWNYPGIAAGDPSNNGSHGCINMYEADAQWIYDNCPEGTVVQVVGTQPTAAVR